MMPPSANIHYTQSRPLWGDGRFSSVVKLRFPGEGLAFAEIDQNQRTVKLRKVTYLRSVKARARGVASPRIVAFARLESDCGVAQALPGVDAETEAGEWTFAPEFGRLWLARARRSEIHFALSYFSSLRARYRAAIAWLIEQRDLLLAGKPIDAELSTYDASGHVVLWHTWQD